LGQELRLTQEQVQNSHTELVEARRQQVQAQREVERLSTELEEIKQLSKEKVISFPNSCAFLRNLTGIVYILQK
jgi:hypothetical protein